MGGPASEPDFAIVGIIGAHEQIDSFFRVIESAWKSEELQNGVAHRSNRVQGSQSPGWNSCLVEIEKIGRRGRGVPKVLRVDHIEQPEAIGFPPGNKLPADPQFQVIRWGNVPNGFPGHRTVLAIIIDDYGPNRLRRKVGNTRLAAFSFHAIAGLRKKPP